MFFHTSKFILKINHLDIYILFSEPVLGWEIDSGMILTPFSSSILDEARFEPTAFILPAHLLRSIVWTEKIYTLEPEIQTTYDWFDEFFISTNPFE